MKRLVLSLVLSGVSLMAGGCYFYPFQTNISSDSDSGSFSYDLVSGSGDEVPDSLDILDEDGVIESGILALQVNSAGLYESFEGNYPEDGDWRFLAVDVTIDSRFENSAILSVDPSLFHLTWEALDGYTVTPELNLYVTDQLADYNNEIRLYKNSSRTGNLIFTVPKEADGFMLIYQDSAIPFDAVNRTDPYNDYYSDDYYGVDPYYNMPFYDSPGYDWYDFFGGGSDWGEAEPFPF